MIIINLFSLVGLVGFFCFVSFVFFYYRNTIYEFVDYARKS